MICIGNFKIFIFPCFAPCFILITDKRTRVKGRNLSRRFGIHLKRIKIYHNMMHTNSEKKIAKILMSNARGLPGQCWAAARTSSSPQSGPPSSSPTASGLRLSPSTSPVIKVIANEKKITRKQWREITKWALIDRRVLLLRQWFSLYSDGFGSQFNQFPRSQRRLVEFSCMFSSSPWCSSFVEQSQTANLLMEILT